MHNFRNSRTLNLGKCVNKPNKVFHGASSYRSFWLVWKFVSLKINEAIKPLFKCLWNQLNALNHIKHK